MKPPKPSKATKPSEREKSADDADEEHEPAAEKPGKKSFLKLPAFLTRKKAKDGEEEEAEREEAGDEEAAEKPGKKSFLKLPAFLTRKKAKDGEEEEAEETAADAEGEEGEESEEGEEGEEGGKSPDRRKRLLLIAASAGVLVLGMAGGVGWWLLAGDDGTQKTAAGQAAGDRSGDATKGPRATMALPPKPGSLNTLVAPAASQKRIGAPDAPGPAAPAPPTFGAPSPTRSAGATLASKSGEIGGAFAGAVDPLGGALNAVGGAVDQSAGIVIPAVTSTTVGRLPDQPRVEPLPGTPDGRLVEEKKPDQPAPLPKIGKDGTMAWQLYARPNKVVEGPRVAILIMDIGLSRAATMAAIAKLPPEVTMVLDPYAPGLSDWVVRARLSGHEVMLAMPMESDRFPVHDAGPFSLDSSLSAEDNLKRLELLLSQVSGYTGVATKMGSRFGTSEELLTPVMEALKGRGLMLVSSGSQGTVATPKVADKVGIPRVLSDLTLDEDPSRLAIEGKLNELEDLLRLRQIVVATAHPYPATVERLINWIATLKDKKIALVPVSALAKKQKPE